MKKIIFSIFIFSLFTFFATAQSVVLEEDVKSDTIVKKWGANRSHFQHLYFDLNFVVDPAEKGAEVRYGLSHGIGIGYRYKKRLCNTFALGLDGSYRFFKYDIKQHKDKKVPKGINYNGDYDKEKYKTHTLSGEAFLRINVGKRGNLVGNFLDIGAYGSWIFGFNHWYKQDYKENWYNVNKPEKETVSETGLNYVEDIEYGLRARIGINRYVLSVSYRMSDLFNGKIVKEGVYPTYPIGINLENMPELPRLQIGLQIGLHK